MTPDPTPNPPADQPGKPVTLQEGKELLGAELTTATTLTDFYALKARQARALHRKDDADLEQRTADAWARRCRVLEKMIGLIDLALADAETLARLKARAAKKITTSNEGQGNAG